MCFLTISPQYAEVEVFNEDEKSSVQAEFLATVAKLSFLEPSDAVKRRNC
jgi:hypothetical protein